MPCDLKNAYYFLQTARRGYELEKAQGIDYHDGAYQATLRLIDDDCFDLVRSEEDEDEDSYGGVY